MVPETLAAAITEIFSVFTTATTKFSEGILLFVPAMFIATWGWNRVIRVFRRR